MRKRILKTAALLTLALALFFVAGLLLSPPPLELARAYPTGGILRDAEGNILRVTLGPGETDCRPLRSLEEAGWCAQALVAAEDQRFYSHHGVDPLAVLRAFRQNITHRRRVSGASTLTMQAIRLIDPPPRRTYANKLREMFRAIRLDHCMAKDDILLQVLNRMPMGSNLAGVGAGAEGWFGKPANRLSLAEAALLAGLGQAPTRLRPTRNPAGAVKRQHFVLDRMAALGMITDEEAALAKAQPLVFRRSPRPFHAPHFCDHALRELRRGGDAAADVTTTLSPRVQRHVATVVQCHAAETGLDFAAVVLRAADGAMLALCASGDYFDAGAGQVNPAVSPRASGSTLKPFAFARAFDTGRIRRASPLCDEAVAFRNYHPSNFDGTFSRSAPADAALVDSLNIPALHVLALIGQRNFYDLLHTLRLTTLRQPAEHYGLGLVIGNAPVTLVELTAAYGVFARDGAWLPATVRLPGETNAVPVFTPETARLVTDILSGQERSQDAFGHVADADVPSFAWKTGTSAGFRDAWTVAWNRDYLVGVWAGHRAGGNKNDARVTGRLAAARPAADIVRLLDPVAAPLPRHAVAAARPVEPAPFVAAPLRIVSPGSEEVFVIAPWLPVESQKIAVRPWQTEPARLFWFVDNAFSAAQPPDRPFFFTPVPGRHTITCTTAAGDAASVTFSCVVDAQAYAE